MFIISKKNYNFATGIKNKAKTVLQCHAKNNCKEIDSKENSDKSRWGFGKDSEENSDKFGGGSEENPDRFRIKLRI